MNAERNGELARMGKETTGNVFFLLLFPFLFLTVKGRGAPKRETKKTLTKQSKTKELRNRGRTTSQYDCKEWKRGRERKKESKANEK